MCPPQTKPTHNPHPSTHPHPYLLHYKCKAVLCLVLHRVVLCIAILISAFTLPRFTFCLPRHLVQRPAICSALPLTRPCLATGIAHVFAVLHFRTSEFSFGHTSTHAVFLFSFRLPFSLLLLYLHRKKEQAPAAVFQFSASTVEANVEQLM